MKIDIHVKHKFKINGREYGSLEEMPENIRETFKKARVTQSATGSDIAQQKIVFNGTEYESMEAMPGDVRQLYENILTAAESGTVPKDSDLLGISQDTLQGMKAAGLEHATEIPPPLKMESAFSLRRLIVIVLAGALAFMIYHLLQIK